MSTSAAPAETTPGADGVDRYVVSVRDLKKHYPIKEGVLQRVTGQVRAVDGVSFDIRRGEIVGMVGESGCGKSSLGQCISGLSNPTSGGVFFDISGTELQRLDELSAVSEEALGSEQRRELDRLVREHRVDRIRGDRWRHYRRNCQVIFQDTYSSLNPRHLVKDIVGRPLRVHREASGSALVERTVDLLESVGLGRQHLYRYPHQFSGGQRQRISIARALALDPELLVLDEPTSALDVSVQAQILNLLSELQHEHDLTYLFISHDLNVVRHMSDRIVVMYLGQVVEHGTSEHLFTDPQHPYTEALLAANPVAAEEANVERKLLEGPVPDPARPPQGCRFHTRCPVVTSVCGWEIDDVVRSLENRPDALDGLARVSRESAFHAHLGFDTEEQASRLTQEIGLGMPAAATDAIEVLRVDGTDVEVRFREVEPVELEETRPGHTVSCVLRTKSRR